MVESTAKPFQFDAVVEPGETRHIRYEIGETYLGDPVEIPITIINGHHPGPRVFLTAAIHGDELNGVKVVQEVAGKYRPSNLHGTLVCLHVVNVPAYHAQTRYIPIYDQDLNRSFPGSPTGNTAARMAHQVYRTFIEQCDLGIDFHTSTRNRTTIFHVRADLEVKSVFRLARSFGANVILHGEGDTGSLRSVASDAAIPTITVEMGRAHRFQPALIDRAVDGVESVLVEFGLLRTGAVDWPGWAIVIPADSEARWIRADTGGLVEMEWGPYPLLHEDERICVITDHFKQEEHVVTAPFTGLLVGVLENPVALPGHPLCHLVRLDSATRDEIENEIASGEFDGYRNLNGITKNDDG